MAKITGFPTAEERRQQDDVNRTSDGGERPPVLRVRQIPTHVANTNVIGTRHGKEWTSRQLIPEEEEDELPRRRDNCKIYFAEEGITAKLPAESTQPMQTGRKATTRCVPEFLRCMFPAAGTLSADEESRLEALVMVRGHKPMLEQWETVDRLKPVFLWNWGEA